MIENKRFRVFDNDFSVYVEDTYYTEDKHEHNLYDVWEMCSKLNELNDENEQFKKALQVAYSTKLTELTKHTIEQIAKHCGVDLE